MRAPLRGAQTGSERIHRDGSHGYTGTVLLYHSDDAFSLALESKEKGTVPFFTKGGVLSINKLKNLK